MSAPNQNGGINPEVVHDCPRDGEAVTLCCGKAPFANYPGPTD